MGVSSSVIAAVLIEEHCEPDEAVSPLGLSKRVREFVDAADLPVWECQAAEKSKLTVGQVRAPVRLCSSTAPLQGRKVPQMHTAPVSFAVHRPSGPVEQEESPQ
jgi:hypothetical protein